MDSGKAFHNLSATTKRFCLTVFWGWVTVIQRRVFVADLWSWTRSSARANLFFWSSGLRSMASLKGKHEQFKFYKLSPASHTPFIRPFRFPLPPLACPFSCRNSPSLHLYRLTLIFSPFPRPLMALQWVRSSSTPESYLCIEMICAFLSLDHGRGQIQSVVKLVKNNISL